MFSEFTCPSSWESEFQVSLPSLFGLKTLSYPVSPLGVTTIPRIGLGARAVQARLEGEGRSGSEGMGRSHSHQDTLVPFFSPSGCAAPTCNTSPSSGRQPGTARAVGLRRNDSTSLSPHLCTLASLAVKQANVIELIERGETAAVSITELLSSSFLGAEQLWRTGLPSPIQVGCVRPPQRHQRQAWA